MENGKLKGSQEALLEAVENSDIQFFTYFPGRRRCEIYARNKRLSELPTIWNDFPDDFLEYTKASEEDAAAYRAMLREIDEGGDAASCEVRFLYKDQYNWERIWIKAIRDEDGNTGRAQGYSMNVNVRRNEAEDLQRERAKFFSRESGAFESFTFNVTENSDPEILTSDKAMLEGEISEEVIRQAALVSPPIGGRNVKTREIMLRAGARIPDEADRERFFVKCGGQGVREAVRQGRSNTVLRYRRWVGDIIRWVETSLRIMRDPNTGDVLAFFYTRDIHDEVIQEKITRSVMRINYESVAFYDLSTGYFSQKVAKKRGRSGGFPDFLSGRG